MEPYNDLERQLKSVVESLPDEILRVIFTFLSFEDAIPLFQVCTKFFKILSCRWVVKEHFKNLFFQRDDSDETVGISEESLTKFYFLEKNNFLECVLVREYCRRSIGGSDGEYYVMRGRIKKFDVEKSEGLYIDVYDDWVGNPHKKLTTNTFIMQAELRLVDYYEFDGWDMPWAQDKEKMKRLEEEKKDRNIAFSWEFRMDSKTHQNFVLYVPILGNPDNRLISCFRGNHKKETKKTMYQITKEFDDWKYVK